MSNQAQLNIKIETHESKIIWKGHYTFGEISQNCLKIGFNEHYLFVLKVENFYVYTNQKNKHYLPHLLQVTSLQEFLDILNNKNQHYQITNFCPYYLNKIKDSFNWEDHSIQINFRNFHRSNRIPIYQSIIKGTFKGNIIFDTYHPLCLAIIMKENIYESFIKEIYQLIDKLNENEIENEKLVIKNKK